VEHTSGSRCDAGSDGGMDAAMVSWQFFLWIEKNRL
jgi:hypothetical protein